MTPLTILEVVAMTLHDSASRFTNNSRSKRSFCVWCVRRCCPSTFNDNLIYQVVAFTQDKKIRRIAEMPVFHEGGFSLKSLLFSITSPLWPSREERGHHRKGCLSSPGTSPRGEARVRKQGTAEEDASMDRGIRFAPRCSVDQWPVSGRKQDHGLS